MKVNVEASEGIISPGEVLALIRRANPTGRAAAVDRIAVCSEGGTFRAKVTDVQFTDGSFVLNNYETNLSAGKPSSFVVVPAARVHTVKVYKS